MIVFVPGIKGSELFEGDNKRWFPSTKKDMQLMNIKNDLTAKSVIGRVRPFGIKKMEQVIYQGLLDEFGPDLMSVFSYDWRKSIYTHVDSLVEKVINLSDETGEKIVLIGHSMGGMLSKLAINELDKRGRIDILEKFITLGTPWHGAPDSYKALLYGEPGIFENLMPFVHFLNIKNTRDLARMLPSAYELLPSKKYYSHTDGKFILSNNINDCSYESFIDHMNRLYNNDKEDGEFNVWKEYMEPLHIDMQADLPPGIVNECLIGYSYPTLYKLPNQNEDVSIKKKYKLPSSFMNGDGVVPIHSAVPDHNANLYFVKGEHSKLCSTEDVLAFLKWIKDRSEENDEMPSGVLKGTKTELPTNSQLKAGILAKVMCPVESTILDDEGKYVAGVFDTNIEGISDLAGEENVKFFSIGESKYIYMADRHNKDIKFDIRAYEEGVASIAIEVYEEEKSTALYFETIAVNNQNSAQLVIPADNIVDNAVLNYKGNHMTPKSEELIQDIDISKEPIPTLKIGFEPSEDVKKVPYRQTYSGPVKLKIDSKLMENISELFYSVDEKNIQKYYEGAILDLKTGEHTIEVFGKDIYNRPLLTVVSKLSIDDEAPKSKLYMLVDPEGVFFSFKGVSNNSNVVINYRFTEDSFEDKEWESTETDKMISLPSAYRTHLLTNSDNSIKVEYYAFNKEFKFKESINSLDFHIGKIAETMWEDTSQAITASDIWGNIFPSKLADLKDFEISELIQNKHKKTEENNTIRDNVRGIRYDSKMLIIEIMFAEKYSLFFSGPPTELLKLGQEYDFSFELKTERSSESLTTTSPKARLHPIKGSTIPDKLISLIEENGVYKGKFKVDENFKAYKHKLIITDNKNTTPPLREIPLLLDEEE